MHPSRTAWVVRRKPPQEVCGDDIPTRAAAEAERTRRAEADAHRDGPPHPDWRPHGSDPIDEYVVVELPLAPS